MPKMKSNSGAKKRFTFTGTGKAKRPGVGKRHNLSSKSTKQKRNLRGNRLVDETQQHQIKAMLPYGNG
jgi:large subunit ribosomal protein L35